MSLTFGSLFAGIGGIDLGFERAGLECRWQVENDEFCQSILTRHWPGIPRYGDVRELSGSTLEAVDVICGGFPCQPVSGAGRRQAQADDRWLWPEFARLVGEMGPRYVVVENVPGLWTTGNAGSEVVADLATLGYHMRWDRLSAAAVGAPHLRERIFIVAHSVSQPGRRKRKLPRPIDRQGRESTEEGRESLQPKGREAHCLDTESTGAVLADTGSKIGFSSWCSGEAALRPFQEQRFGRRSAGSQWGRDPAEVPESGVGRVAHGVPGRLDQLRTLGNAVVPQVAQVIGERLVELDAAL